GRRCGAVEIVHPLGEPVDDHAEGLAGGNEAQQQGALGADDEDGDEAGHALAMTAVPLERSTGTLRKIAPTMTMTPADTSTGGSQARSLNTADTATAVSVMAAKTMIASNQPVEGRDWPVEVCCGDSWERVGEASRLIGPPASTRRSSRTRAGPRCVPASSYRRSH